MKVPFCDWPLGFFRNELCFVSSAGAGAADGFFSSAGAGAGVAATAAHVLELTLFSRAGSGAAAGAAGGVHFLPLPTLGRFSRAAPLGAFCESERRNGLSWSPLLFRFESDFLASAGSAPSTMLIRSIGMMC